MALGGAVLVTRGNVQVHACSSVSLTRTPSLFLADTPTTIRNDMTKNDETARRWPPKRASWKAKASIKGRLGKRRVQQQSPSRFAKAVERLP